MDGRKRKEGRNDQSFGWVRCPDRGFSQTSEQTKSDKRWIQNGTDPIETIKFEAEKSIIRSD